MLYCLIFCSSYILLFLEFLLILICFAALPLFDFAIYLFIKNI